MDCEDDGLLFSTSSSSSSSSSSAVLLSAKNNLEVVVGKTTTTTTHKRKTGRKKFKETRHPVYRGVRKKNGSKWVSEVREPNNKKSRIWLGTFPTPEMAARAHDVAVLALRGGGDSAAAALNFADSASRLPRPQSSSAADIQIAAFLAAEAFRPPPSQDTPPPPLVNISSSSSSLSSSSRVFEDEEAMFNMPVLINSMAEGLLLTPPAMKKGFQWNDMEDDDFEFISSLWKDN